MKKCYVQIILSLFVALFANAKGPNIIGSFSALDDDRVVVDVKLDYTSAEMDDMSFEKALYVMEFTKEQWDLTIVPILISRFCEEANNECDAFFREESATPSRYKLEIKVLSVDDDGETEARLTLVDNVTGYMLGEVVLNADGGRFGSWHNLMGDALARIGKELGELVDD